MADAPKEARVFSPQNRLQTLGRRPGGVARQRAIESAQAEIEQVTRGFDDWLETELQTLMRIVARARAGEADPDWVAAAQLHCKQLRDVGTTVGFELLTFVAGSLCTILDGIMAGAEYNMESITCHLDALLLIRQPAYRHLRPGQLPELSGGLNRVAETVSIVPGLQPK